MVVKGLVYLLLALLLLGLHLLLRHLKRKMV